MKYDLAATLLLSLSASVNGHGFLSVPRSRTRLAWETPGYDESPFLPSLKER